MDNTNSVSTLIDCTTSKIQQLQKAFAELESHRAVTLNLKWKELEEHFHGLEKSLKRRFHELESQEKEFESRTVEAQKLLEKRQAAVVAKEQASLETLQEKRDAAIYVITTAREKQRKVSTEESSVVTDDGQGGPPSVEEKPPDVMVSESNFEEMKSAENGSIEVMSYPQLVKLCEQMDSEGLHKFISDNRKNLASIREEIPLALRAAANPALFVLESLEDFYRLEGPNMDGKKDSNLLGVRRTCIMLMECLSILLTNPDLVSASDVITEEVKDLAEAIAEEWKPKLDALDMDASNGNSLEAHAFLQLLATFGIASGFDEEELFRLIPMVSRRRQTADLCRSLGLTERMPGVIEVLVSSGRQIDAVNLAFAFELTEQFSPVPLLKSYLKEARKASLVKPGNASPTAQNEVNDRELAALKAVLKSIEEHKLEDQYPVDPLQKRVLQLEKAKADKKRVAEAAKPQPKRPRANGVGYGPRVTNVVADKTFYPRVAENRYPQYMYDRQFFTLDLLTTTAHSFIDDTIEKAIYRVCFPYPKQEEEEESITQSKRTEPIQSLLKGPRTNTNHIHFQDNDPCEMMAVVHTKQAHYFTVKSRGPGEGKTLRHILYIYIYNPSPPLFFIKSVLSYYFIIIKSSYNSYIIARTMHIKEYSLVLCSSCYVIKLLINRCDLD